MAKRRRIWLLAGMLVALVALVCLALHDPEPSYKGKSLRVWILKDTSPEFGYSKEAKEAVLQIGTNGVPIFLKMLRAKDSKLKSGFIKLLEKQSLVGLRLTPAGDKNLAACRAFEILGADARTAVPELVKIYEENISTGSQCLTAASIGYIGPSASNAISALLRGVKTTNDPVRWNTVWALGKIHGEPELVLPVLLKLIRDPNSFVARHSSQALGDYGTNARPVVRDLIKMLNDPNEATRYFATNALKQIDPEAAAKAGVN